MLWRRLLFIIMMQFVFSIDYSDQVKVDFNGEDRDLTSINWNGTNIDFTTVNISALDKAVTKLQSDVEKLKDKQRSFGNGGNH